VGKKIPIVRGSERTALLRCPARWWWGYREGLVPKGQQFNALWFGEGIHVALAAWYEGPGAKRGPEPVETWLAFVGDSLAYVKTTDPSDEDVAKYEDARTLGEAMLTGYRELYGADNHIHVISPEQSFSFELPWPIDTKLFRLTKDAMKKSMAIYAGRWDLAYRDLRSDNLKLEEHKTAASISTRHLALDNQGGSYWAVATRSLRSLGLIKEREILSGVEYNFLRKGMPDERPKDSEGYACNKPVKADYIAAINAAAGDEFFSINPKLTLAALEAEAERLGLTVLGERSKVQPAKLFERHMIHRTRAEQRSQLLRIQTDALLIRAYTEGRIPITKNPTKDCGWDCSFYDMCELQERGGNWQEFRDMKYERRDPYSDHRKSAAE
jgi:hypothetical protein